MLAIHSRLTNQTTPSRKLSSKCIRTINCPISILIHLLHHNLQLLIRQILAKRLHHVRDLVAGDGAAAVLVEDLERAAHLLFEVGRLGFRGHHLDEFYIGCLAVVEARTGRGRGQTIEINGAGAVDVYFVDHVVELCIGGIETEGLHHGAELVSCDDAWDRKAC
jgi:hypothetical protein